MMTTLMEEAVRILVFIASQFRSVWPFLLISIPLSVAINLSGAGEKIGKVTGRSVWISVPLATFIGALSPLCSCTVIPVVFSLLTAGVPLAPVMSFWIASPSMDPEIFFLSVTTLGWPLAIWRLAGTFVLSLSAGFITHLLQRSAWLPANPLRSKPVLRQTGMNEALQGILRRASTIFTPKAPVPAVCCAAPMAGRIEVQTFSTQSCSTPAGAAPACSPAADNCGHAQTKSFWPRFREESVVALRFVGKFLFIAYLVESLIVLYLPNELVSGVLGGDGLGSVVIASAFGVPLYTTNFAALGLLGGLLSKGMLPGAALAFLIAGPTTTLPAMSAVFGIAKPRVFALYLAFAFFGAILFGSLYSLIM